MTSLARSERTALCNLLERVGPDAPTLCAPWTTRDLAAHLVVRESRPDAAAGIVVGALAGWTRRVQDAEAGRDWATLVAKIRSGPPGRSPVRIGTVDDAVNTVEFFVHHEDVRRAISGWEPRDLSDDDRRQLWSVVRQRARLHFRRAPVGVILQTPDGRRLDMSARGTPVTLVGDPGELTLYMNGRTTHARVTVTGDAVAVSAFEGTDLSV